MTRIATTPAALVALLSGGLAACSGGGTTVADAGADAPASGGLVFTWDIDPAIGSDDDDDLEITVVDLALRDLRALGDSAPGDMRTSRSALRLSWLEAEVPAPLVFDQAPPGLYSRLELRLGGGADQAYTIRGRVLDDETWLPCEIRDDAAIAVTVPLEVMLAVDGTETVPIVLDLDEVMDAVDWTLVPERDGVRVLDGDDPQLAEVRQELADSVLTAPDHSPDD